MPVEHRRRHVHIQACSLALTDVCAVCRFYFTYCEAAFDARYIHNFQITWTKAAEAGPAEPDTVAGSADAAATAALPPSSRDPPDPVTQVRASRITLAHSPTLAELHTVYSLSMLCRGDLVHVLTCNGKARFVTQASAVSSVQGQLICNSPTELTEIR